MGVVYRARRRDTGLEVAIKLLRAGAHANSAQQERFRRELAVLKRLNHANVISVLDAGQTQAGPWFATPLLAGKSLEDRIKDEGPLPLDEAMDLAAQLASALEHVHRSGLLHRDLKPDNVLQRLNGDLVTWTLLDFGLVKDLEIEHTRALSKSGAILGTPGYWAPEQASAGTPSPQTDVYGFGATLYAALTGQPPVEVGGSFWEIVVATQSQLPVPPRRLRPDLSQALEELLLRCLAKDPAERPPDGAALRHALEALQADTTPRLLSGWALALGVLLICVVALLLGAAVVQRNSALPPADSSPTTSAAPTLSLDPVPQARAKADEGEAALALGRRYAIGYERPQDLALAARHYREAIKAGNSDAYGLLLGLLLQRADERFDPKRDAAEALQIAREGVRAKAPRAYRALGYIHLDGLCGLLPDAREALQIFRAGAALGDVGCLVQILAQPSASEAERLRAAQRLTTLADGGDPNSSYWLSRLARHPQIQADQATADRLMERAVELGSPEALRSRGKSLIDEGTVLTQKRGLKLLQRSAQAGDVDAMLLLAGFLLKGGPGIPRDHQQALQWSERAGALGDVAAMNRCYDAYYLGFGCERDRREAVRWARLAAARDDGKGLSNLGAAYFHGQGAPQDLGRAISLYQRGAALGHLGCAHALALAQLTGTGLPKDEAAARVALQDLANRGHNESHYVLGNMFLAGRGIGRDPVRAREHFEAAVAARSLRALVALGILCRDGIAGPRDRLRARELLNSARQMQVPGAHKALEVLDRLEEEEERQKKIGEAPASPTREP